MITSPSAFGPPAPAARAVVSAWRTNDAAPRAELTAPLRSRDAAITGAAIGVDTVASSALRPLTLL
jgi:hypothetical protein